MAKHLLTDTKVRNLKPAATPYRKPDGDNLYVNVAPSGVKSWQFRYRLDGKPQTFTLGKYPAKSLADAREAAEKARTARGGGASTSPSPSASRSASGQRMPPIPSRLSPRYGSGSGAAPEVVARLPGRGRAQPRESPVAAERHPG